MNQYQYDVESGFPYPGANNVQPCDKCEVVTAVSYGPDTYEEFEAGLIQKGWKRVVVNVIEFWYCPTCCSEIV